MPEGDYRAEFEQSVNSVNTENSSSGSPTSEEMLELAVGNQKVRLPLSVEVPWNHNGQLQKTPLKSLLNNARQQAHLEEKLKKLNGEMEGHKPNLEQFNTWKERLLPLQKWSEENPDQFNSIWELYENRDKHLLQKQVGEEENPLVNEITALKQKLAKTEEFMSNFEKQQKVAEEKAADESLDKEISEFKSKYKELGVDLADKDENGLSLESRILSFGFENRIQDFEAAALKFLGGTLLEKARVAGMSKAVKGIQNDKAQGIVGKSRTPFVSGQNDLRPEKESWGSLLEKARDEFDSMKGAA